MHARACCPLIPLLHVLPKQQLPPSESTAAKPPSESATAKPPSESATAKPPSLACQPPTCPLPTGTCQVCCGCWVTVLAGPRSRCTWAIATIT